MVSHVGRARASSDTRHKNYFHVAYNIRCMKSTLQLSGDGDLNFDTRLQTDTRLGHAHQTSGERRVKKKTHDLLDNLARRVEVNEALVDFEFVAIPGLGSLTARLEKRGRY